MPWVPIIALAAGLCTLTLRNLPRTGRMATAFAATLSLLILGARDRQQANVNGYYSAILGEQNLAQALPVLLTQSKSATIATYGFAPGIAEVVRPDARIVEMPDAVGACSFASSIKGVVFVHAGARPTITHGCSLLHAGVDDFEVVTGSGSQLTD